MGGKRKLSVVRHAARAIGTVYLGCDEFRNRQFACGRLSGTEFSPEAWDRMNRARSREGRAGDPELAQLLDMAACLGMREAAVAVQRTILPFYDRLGIDIDGLQPEGTLRPEIVVDNTGGAGKEYPAAKRGAEKRAAVTRPAGDAA